MNSYIICLSKIPASLETALQLKKQLKNFNMPAELFEGTYGTEAVKLMKEEGRVLHPFGIKGPNAAPPSDLESASKIESPGVKGCFYSHYRLWQKCADINKPIIIWEDDIVVLRPYIPVEWKDVLVLSLGHPTKSEKYKDFLHSPIGEPRAVEYHQTSMPGCCGYALQPHAAKKLVETYSKTFLPADNAINQYHVTIQIHNYVMGTALTKKDGKKSLTRTSFWETYQGIT